MGFSADKEGPGRDIRHRDEEHRKIQSDQEIGADSTDDRIQRHAARLDQAVEHDQRRQREQNEAENLGCDPHELRTGVGSKCDADDRSETDEGGDRKDPALMALDDDRCEQHEGQQEREARALPEEDLPDRQREQQHDDSALPSPARSEMFDGSGELTALRGRSGEVRYASRRSTMRSSTSIRTALLVLLFGLPWTWNGLGCKTPPPPATPGGGGAPQTKSLAGRQAECLPQFPDHGGWYGADSAYSVALPIDDGRESLWLFGDSFVAQTKTSPRRAYPFIHNSIGLSHCSPNGAWHLETIWRKIAGAAPRAFFEPDPRATWVREATERTGALPYYWPFGGFITDDTLFVGLLRVVHSEPHGPFHLPFRLVGMDLARVANYRDSPREWTMQVSNLSETTDGFPGSAFVVTRAYLYAFTFLDRGDDRSPRTLCRLDLDALRTSQTALSQSLECLKTNQGWQPGLTPSDAMILMDDDATEMSVHFDPESARWLAVYSRVTSSGDASDSGSIWLRSAARLEGPWSKAAAILAIPEMRPDPDRGVDQNLFCYAAKAHPQFARPNELLVTYVCNLFARNPGEAERVLRTLRDSPDLYRPRAVSLESLRFSDPPSASRTRPSEPFREQ